MNQSSEAESHEAESHETESHEAESHEAESDVFPEEEIAAETAEAETSDDSSVRVIKRYSNRKLYDTRESRYVTLLQVAEMVRAGEEVQVVDNATKEDKTDITLALIISEELKSKPRGIPLPTLKALIRHRGGKLLNQFREGPMARFRNKDGQPIETVINLETESLEKASEPLMQEIPVNSGDFASASSPAQREGNAIRRTLEQWQHTIDERMRSLIPLTQFRLLEQRVAQLERELAELKKSR